MPAVMLIHRFYISYPRNVVFVFAYKENIVLYGTSDENQTEFVIVSA
jgi:hypothetical protein